jgi:DHA1 family multidrug resistance protein-like MFS transporter
MSDLLHNRNIALVLTNCCIFGFVLGLSLLVVPLYTLTLSDSPLVLATVVAVFPLTAVLLSLASGAISELFGSRAMLIGAFGLMGAGCLVLAVARSWQVVLVGQLLLGLGDVACWIPIFGFLSRLAPPGQQYAVQGLGGAAQQIGTILGPFAGGLVASLAGFAAAFLLGGGLALVGVVVAMCMRRVGAEGGGARSLSNYLVVYHRRALGLLVRNRAVLWATLVHAVILLGWPVMRGSFYLASLASQGLSSSDSGSIVSAHLLVGSLAGLCLGRLSAGRSMTRLLLAIAAFGAITVGITPLLTSVPVLVVTGCAGGVVGLYTAALIGFLAENADLPERSMGVALINLSWAVASPTGLFVVGLLVDRVSLQAGFLLTETLALFGIGLLWIWAERRLG